MSVLKLPANIGDVIEGLELEAQRAAINDLVQQFLAGSTLTLDSVERAWVEVSKDGGQYGPLNRRRRANEYRVQIIYKDAVNSSAAGSASDNFNSKINATGLNLTLTVGFQTYTGRAEAVSMPTMMMCDLQADSCLVPAASAKPANSTESPSGNNTSAAPGDASDGSLPVGEPGGGFDGDGVDGDGVDGDGSGGGVLDGSFSGSTSKSSTGSSTWLIVVIVVVVLILLVVFVLFATGYCKPKGGTQPNSSADDIRRDLEEAHPTSLARTAGSKGSLEWEMPAVAKSPEGAPAPAPFSPTAGGPSSPPPPPQATLRLNESPARPASVSESPGKAAAGALAGTVSAWSGDGSDPASPAAAFSSSPAKAQRSSTKRRQPGDRGKCNICGQLVFVTQRRDKLPDGSYNHSVCPTASEAAALESGTTDYLDVAPNLGLTSPGKGRGSATSVSPEKAPQTHFATNA